MPVDLSRKGHETRNGYNGVVAQQGRVIIDRDFNAFEETLSEQLGADVLDIVGNYGTPDDGFAVSIPGLSPPGSPFWNPPPPAQFTETSTLDFLVSPGTMYVGGQRAYLSGEQNGTAITYSYFDQPDWIDPDPPGVGPGTSSTAEIVYLELYEKEVSAVEDPDLLEVALGGPDTTQRLRLMRRIRRRPTSGSACTDSWDELIAQWQSQGLKLDQKTMRLLPDAGLQVSFIQDPSMGNPCDPVATGGYLGQNNQLIRVQICGTHDNPQLLWGWDDASFLYRVAAIAYNGQALQLTQDPADLFHYPQAGQVIEVLRTTAVLGSELDETNPNAPQTIERCIAEATGEVEALLKPYGPVNPGDPKYLYFAPSLPPQYQSDTNPLFVRIWQAQQNFTPGVPCELIDPVTGGSTGLQVTIAPQLGGVLPTGVYWQIAVRPATPQAVYPEELLLQPQQPDGPQGWVCPLAFIDWSTLPATVQNCRQTFDNLVTLSNRKSGGSCCTVYVLPDDLKIRTLQEIIDQAIMASPFGATICLAPGTFTLTATVSVSRASNLTIRGAGTATLVDASVLDTAFTFSGCDNLALEDIVVQSGGPTAPQGMTGSVVTVVECQSTRLTNCTVRCGVIPSQPGNLTPRACVLTRAPTVIPLPFSSRTRQAETSAEIVRSRFKQSIARLFGLPAMFRIGPTRTRGAASLDGGHTISGLTPTSGPVAGGTPIVISGTGFNDVSNVQFGSTDANWSRISDIQINATSPRAQNAGTVDVTVVTDFGNPTAKFMYGPDVTGVNPPSGPVTGGTPVVISGAGFTGATSVTFGGTSVTLTPSDIISDGQINTTSPPASGAGTVDIAVVTPNGNSVPTWVGNNWFTYAVPAGPPPSITLRGCKLFAGAGHSGFISIGTPSVKLGDSLIMSLAVAAYFGIDNTLPPSLDPKERGLGGVILLAATDLSATNMLTMGFGGGYLTGYNINSVSLQSISCGWCDTALFVESIGDVLLQDSFLYADSSAYQDEAVSVGGASAVDVSGNIVRASGDFNGILFVGALEGATLRGNNVRFDGGRILSWCVSVFARGVQYIGNRSYSKSLPRSANVILQGSDPNAPGEITAVANTCIDPGSKLLQTYASGAMNVSQQAQSAVFDYLNNLNSVDYTNLTGTLAPQINQEATALDPGVAAAQQISLLVAGGNANTASNVLTYSLVRIGRGSDCGTIDGVYEDWITVTPTGMVLTPAQSQSLSVSETNYTGTFSALSSDSAVVTLGPPVPDVSGVAFLVTAQGNGTATVTISDVNQNSVTVSVTVATPTKKRPGAVIKKASGLQTRPRKLPKK